MSLNCDRVNIRSSCGKVFIFCIFKFSLELAISQCGLIFLSFVKLNIDCRLFLFFFLIFFLRTDQACKMMKKCIFAFIRSLLIIGTVVCCVFAAVPIPKSILNASLYGKRNSGNFLISSDNIESLFCEN